MVTAVTIKSMSTLSYSKYWSYRAETRAAH